MIVPFVSFCLHRRWMILTLVAGISFLGFYALRQLAIEAYPDVGDVTAQVITQYPGHAAEEVEQQITIPLERQLNGIPDLHVMRSQSTFGLSLIDLVFEDGTEDYFVRQRIQDRINSVALPPGVQAGMDSVTPPTGEIYRYTLQSKLRSPRELRDLNNWVVIPRFIQVAGVIGVDPFGGENYQFQVFVDPNKLAQFNLTLAQVETAISANNINSGGSVIVRGEQSLVVRGMGAITQVEDLANIVITQKSGAPVFVKDIGHAEMGVLERQGILGIDDNDDAVSGIVQLLKGKNPSQVLAGVHRQVEELNTKLLPPDVQVVPYLDRTALVNTTLHTVSRTLLEGMTLVVVVLMLFLGSLRATTGTFLSIPLSAMATFIVLAIMGSTVNVMILGGLALVFSRLIDNSVVVLENIYRHLENGEAPALAAETGGGEVTLPVLAATLTTAIAFFPVTFLYGVSKYLFTALALAVVLALFASYFVAMTVMPLFCARFLHHQLPTRVGGAEDAAETFQAVSLFGRFNLWFNRRFEGFLSRYDRWVRRLLARPALALALLLALCGALLAAAPLVGVAYFPRTDPGQFVINVKAATGTRVEETTAEIAKVEATVRRIVAPGDLDVIASNIGVTPDFSAIYTSNSGTHMAFVQVNLKEGHRFGSYDYMNRVRRALAAEQPQLTTYFQTGGLVDAVLNMGLPAPIDIQVSGDDLNQTAGLALSLARRIRAMPGVGDVFIPQDVDAPSLTIDVNRTYASELGLSQQEVVDNIITALTSNQMIAPSYWVDPRNGNDYMLTVQYPEDIVQSVEDLKAIPIRAASQSATVRLDAVANIRRTLAPTVVNHYQLKRIIDIYVAPEKEALGGVAARINALIAGAETPENMTVTLRGAVEAMHTSFVSFAAGLLMSLVLIYLILVAQFRSFVDPFIILLAVPPGIAGAVDMLVATGTTLNVMSLMGTVMLVGIAVSNSILIVEFAHRLRAEGRSASEAVAQSCRVRLRPILMTSLATVIGLIPMALALGAGSETYASLARVVIGGLTVSVAVTVFIVPAAYLLVYRRGPSAKPETPPTGAEQPT